MKRWFRVRRRGAQQRLTFLLQLGFMQRMDHEHHSRARAGIGEVFFAFLSLGLRSFGGPIAHLGYFRDEFVGRRHWLDDNAYADLVALCQFLPGPASSQVGIALGYGRAGYGGALAAFIGFTAPSALIMLAVAAGATLSESAFGSAVIHGLKLAAVAVVAQAVLAMSRSLAPDTPRRSLALFTACALLLFPHAWVQIGVILAGAAFGLRFIGEVALPAEIKALPHPPRRHGLILLGLFFGLLIAAPFLAETAGEFVRVLAVFYQSGSLVFGGGHVVLPMLESGLVPWAITDDLFLAGYGAAQALPGPLFAFAAFIGSAMNVSPHGVLGGLAALIAIFLPAMLLVLGAIPFWADLRSTPQARRAMAGVNAAVVGVLAAALYDPVFTAGVKQGSDMAIVLACLWLLEVAKRPSWWAVVLAACASVLLRFV